MMCATVLPLKSGQGGIHAVAHTPAPILHHHSNSKLDLDLVRNNLPFKALRQQTFN